MVHTKLSSPTESSNFVITDHTLNEENDSMDKARSSKSYSTVPSSKSALSNLNTDVFIKELNLILYGDDKSSLHKKSNIASLFLDDFIVCYTDEV